MTSYYDQLKGGKIQTDYVQEYRAKQAEEDKETEFSDTLGAAYENNFIWNSAIREEQRRSDQFKKDANFSVTKEMRMENSLEYDEEDQDYLNTSKSSQEYLARKAWIEEDKKRRKILADAGGLGTLAQIGMSVADPVGLVAGVMTGGIGYSAKAGKVANTLRQAGVGGVTELGLEAALQGGDTQSEASDLIFAFGGGAIIGGAVGAFSKARPRADAADAAIAADADGHAISQVVKSQETVASSPITRVSETVSYVPDERAMAQTRDYYELDLEEAVKGRITRQEVSNLRKQQKEFHKLIEEENIRARASETDGDILRLREEVQAAKAESVTLRQTDEAAARKLVKDAEARLSKELNFRKLNNQRAARIFQTSLREITRKLNNAKRAKQAAKDLKVWRNSTPDQQMDILFGPNSGRVIPNKQEVIRKQLETQETMKANPREPLEDIDLNTGEVRSTGKSVGAASVGPKGYSDELYELDASQADNLNKFFTAGANVPADLVGSVAFKQNTGALGAAGNFVAKYAQGLHTFLSNSQSYTVRGLNYHLFEAPQGGTAAKVTAAIRSHVNARRIRAAMKYRLDEGFEDYARGKGVNFVKAELSVPLRKEFWKKVFLEAKYPGTYKGVPGVEHAAAGVRDQLSLAGKIRKDAGEAGFENLNVDKNYVTTVLDDDAIFNAINNHGRGAVRSIISEAYQRGKFKLTPKVADDLADAYITRSTKNKISVRNSYREVSGKDYRELADGLEKAGVDRKIIDDFLETSQAGEAKKHMSDRARMSLEPDVNISHGSLNMIDLVETNLPRLLESYTIDAAGGSAMARLGFKTRQQFQDFLAAVEQEGYRNNVKNISEQVQMIQDGVDMIYGRSINQYAHTNWSRNISRARDITALLRLQKVGLSAIPESARAITHRGLSNFLEQVPAVGNFVKGTRSQRKGGKFSGELSDPELRELDEVFQYAGEDHVIYPNTLRSDEIEEAGFQTGVGQKLDQWLAQGKRIQELTSFFRAFQGGGEKIAARSLNRNIRRWMYDGEKLRISDAELKSAGWSDDFLKDMKQWVKKNPASEVYNGKTINVFDFDRMPSEMKERYAIGVQRLVARDMQRAFVGETPTFMHKIFGQTITQFRSFSITSLDKQLIHDIKHDKAAGALIGVWSAGLGFMTYMVDGMLTGDADKRASLFETQNVIFGTWNRMGQVAATGIALDGLATLGAVPDSLMAAPNRYGLRTYGWNSIPVAGLASDVGKIGPQIADVITGNEDTSPSSLVNQIQKVTPFARVVGINQAFNAIEEGLE